MVKVRVYSLRGQKDQEKLQGPHLTEVMQKNESVNIIERKRSDLTLGEG